MKLPPEWNDRLRNWLDTLEKDFYLELGEPEFQGFTTFDHLTLNQVEKKKFKPFPPGTEWGEDWQYLWLRGKIKLPESAQGKTIIFNLATKAESTIFVNGEPFGNHRTAWATSPHHFLCDNILTQNADVGMEFSIHCELYAGHFYEQSPRGVFTGPVMPGDFQNPLDGKPYKTLERATYGIWNEDAYALWMDAKTLLDIMEKQTDGSLRAAKIADALKRFMLLVDFEKPYEKRLIDYKNGRDALREVLSAENGSTAPTYYAIGNAHLDVVWLWPYAETVRKTARTFAAQLRMIENYPGYKFMQSQPQTYVMCKENYPELYEKVKAAVRKGGWVVEGGMWVEPDTNMTSGESLIRQLMHGKRFFREEFNIDSEILWLPDTFGYTAALPQILKGCGIKYLVTQKIFWSYNDGEQFPYHYFTWKGSDGTEVVSFLPTSYTYDTNPATLIDLWENRVQKDSMDKFLLPFGYGDGGAGPCRDHLEYVVRQENLEGSPRVKMEHPGKLFSDLAADGGPKDTYVGELYFTAHRGVYTTQAAIKRGNRKAEILLREAEMWGAIAGWEGFTYPLKEIDKTWKKTLTNQFHDILPGSSIAKANREAEAMYDEIFDSAGKLIDKAAKHLTADEGTTVFNSLSWERSAVVIDPTTDKEVLVKLPPCGMALLSGSEIPVTGKNSARATKLPNGAVLENSLVRAELNSSGEVVSFVLKQSGREFASGAMNRFALYRDIPRTFDAWDIDSMYEDEQIQIGTSAELKLVSSGDVRASVEVTKKIGNSSLRQIISLCAGSRRLEFATTIEWNELHRLLKTCFPVNVAATEAINEMQYGYIKRPTHRSRAYDKDRFEVCNHRYTAMCDENHGAAVLNDSKYGVSMLGNEIRLTLLRAAACPEMRADNGTQRFTYAFTAWEGSFFDSPAPREGLELNVPPLVVSGGMNNKLSESFFHVKHGDSIIIDTVKPAEDGSGDIIVRLYESKRADCRSVLHASIPFAKVSLTDMLENEEELLLSENGPIKLHFRPFEVKTLRFSR
jgi:alpha-mannosidase